MHMTHGAMKICSWPGADGISLHHILIDQRFSMELEVRGTTRSHQKSEFRCHIWTLPGCTAAIDRAEIKHWVQQFAGACGLRSCTSIGRAGEERRRGATSIYTNKSQPQTVMSACVSRSIHRLITQYISTLIVGAARHFNSLHEQHPNVMRMTQPPTHRPHTITHKFFLHDAGDQHPGVNANSPFHDSRFLYHFWCFQWIGDFCLSQRGDTFLGKRALGGITVPISVWITKVCLSNHVSSRTD